MLNGNVLFIGAHTDDIELFAGGLLSKMAKSGQAKCLTFSSHLGVTNAELAAEEHHDNMTWLKTDYVLHDMGACDGSFQLRRADIYEAVFEAVKLQQPSLIVTHPVNDTNQDHRQVVYEVLRVAKAKTSIVSGCYPFNQVAGELPNMFVELDQDELAQKITMIQRYESQQQSHRKYFNESVWQGLSVAWGAQIGARYAEAFNVVRIQA